MERGLEMSIKNKISVFGGTGFIGSRFCEMYPHNAVKIERESRIPINKDILFLISTTDNYNIFTEPTKDIETNLIILMEVLKNCTPKNTFNFVSSWFVYGNQPLPIKETSQCDPKGIYAITKRCAEQLIICYCVTFKIPYRIFRLENVLRDTLICFSKHVF